LEQVAIAAARSGGAPSPRLTRIRAEVLAAAGRFAEAARGLEEAEPAPEAESLAQGIVRLQVAAHLDSEAAVEKGAIALIERLDTQGRELLPPGRLMHLAESVGRILTEHGQATRLAHRAFELAGEAALLRMGELDGFLRELPHLRHASPEDREMLAAWRERFVAAHGGLLDAVADLFGNDSGAATRLTPPGRSDPPIVCMCAWCRRIRGPEGAWIPLRRFEAPRGRFVLTHGICEACYDAVGR
jgi:hypothetical protein